MSTQVVILAAGQGKRMHSTLSKVLHPLAGKPLLAHVVNTAMHIAPERHPIVVYGHGGEQVRAAFTNLPLQWVQQTEQLGTGHAVLQALSLIDANDHVLVLYGDVPLVAENTLQQLISAIGKKDMGLITAQLANPYGYGRIKRNAQHEIQGIVEEKDASAAERQINEVNSGIFCVPAAYLKQWLPKLKNNNAQKEYYLTDIIALAVAEKIAIHGVQPMQYEEILGVNDRVQLAHLERFYQRQQVERLMRAGVTVLDPARLDIRGEMQIASDVTIDVNVILEGDVRIGRGCYIGAHCCLRNVVIGEQVEIKAHSILDGAEIASGCIIGPFARLRPGAVLAKHVHIGNFVEIKNTFLNEGTKVNHLSYLGDSEVGKRVNVGAGTITCNYDGVNKHKTIIGDDVFIGSDTQLVAPVTVGDGAIIGAGATIVKNVPSNQLTVTHRLEQRSKPSEKKIKEAKK